LIYYTPVKNGMDVIDQLGFLTGRCTGAKLSKHKNPAPRATSIPVPVPALLSQDWGQPAPALAPVVGTASEQSSSDS
jgi:hypothetical protein